MRQLILLAAALFCGCDYDWDGKTGPADCDPHSSLNECENEENDVDTDVDSDTDTDTDSDADTDSDTDSDTSETGETGDTADTADTAVPCEEVIWYRDADADGFGDAAETVTECEPPPDGYVADSTDCDDGDATVYPGAPEACDGLDNDCDVDGSIDENVSSVWYNDADDDGYGNPDESVDLICNHESEWLVDNGDDCDDTNIDVNPVADEYCNEIDDDCDGVIDPASSVDTSEWFADVDADGFGDSSSVVASCDEPSGYVDNTTDCDDSNSAVSPAGVESCNEIDDDCDGVIDPDTSSDASVWYVDADSDGYGDSASTSAACSQPSGYVSDSSDCDDNFWGSYPGAAESCDGADNDCDGTVDESDATDVAIWYYDADGDGYGDASVTFSSCSAPAGYVSDATDCNDSDSEVNPGATEVCNEVDDNCDGSTDGSDSADAAYWVVDADGDGYGDDNLSSAQLACEQPVGYVDNAEDCLDSDSSVSPDATEVDDDFLDNDCDGIVDSSGIFCCEDNDSDGYGNPDACIYDDDSVCDAGYVDQDGDCDGDLTTESDPDSNSTINPGADDPLSDDGTDYNCDGLD